MGWGGEVEGEVVCTLLASPPPPPPPPSSSLPASEAGDPVSGSEFSAEME